jgi:hypothetical protein
VLDNVARMEVDTRGRRSAAVGHMLTYLAAAAIIFAAGWLLRVPVRRAVECALLWMARPR